ncbi:MAG: hypothetical protein IJJ15_03040 [Ruminococcus sp.]|nr:hypothetical protein [Ruminococcus sp.]
MMKGLFGFVCGVAAGAGLVMLYLHKDAIKALCTGEEMPEAPECCPFSKATESEETCEETCEEKADEE